MASKFAIVTVIKTVDKVTRPVRRMTRNVTRAAASMGRAFVKLTKITAKFARSMAGIGGKFAKFGSFAAGGLSAALVLLNRSTVQSDLLATSTGLVAENLAAYAAAVAPAGFNLDNVNDLAEEMNNKFGEIATIGAPVTLQEGLKTLGLRARELNKLAPDERFRKIADSILAMKDQTQALSAADKIFGGEANKVFGVLRAQAGTTEQLIHRYRELNFLTEDGRKGAHSFNSALTQLMTAVTSIAREVSGLAGDALAPLITKMTEWIKQNRELVKLKIAEAVTHIRDAVEAVLKFIKDPDAKKRFDQILGGVQALVPQVDKLSDSLRAMGKVAEMAFAPFKIVGEAIGNTAGFVAVSTSRLMDNFATSATAGGQQFQPTGLGFTPVVPQVAQAARVEQSTAGRRPAPPTSRQPVTPVTPQQGNPKTTLNGEIVVSAGPGSKVDSVKGGNLISTQHTGAF